MDNMALYNNLCTPPNDALKTIKFGNLKGKSDINPQWRYEAITNQFGACGTGWKFTIDSHWTQPVPTGEIMVYVMISFYYKLGETWSEPIPAYGGDFLVKKDKNGIHGNDEALKMAVTDALGTAMKMIGVAADVYRGLVAEGASDSKYSRRDYAAAQTQQPARQQARPKTNKPTPMQRLTAEIKRLNLTNKEVAEVAERKMHKTTTRDMTEEEIVMLAVNLEAWTVGGE